MKKKKKKQRSKRIFMVTKQDGLMLSEGCFCVYTHSHTEKNVNCDFYFGLLMRKIFQYERIYIFSLVLSF